MPRLDGVEAARQILARRPMPIVMLTAFDQEELVVARGRGRRLRATSSSRSASRT